MAGRDPAVERSPHRAERLGLLLDDIIRQAARPLPWIKSEDRRGARHRATNLKHPTFRGGQVGNGECCWPAGGVKNTIPQANSVS
jgi:hypothetical protein